MEGPWGPNVPTGAGLWVRTQTDPSGSLRLCLLSGKSALPKAHFAHLQIGYKVILILAVSDVLQSIQ